MNNKTTLPTGAVIQLDLAKTNGSNRPTLIIVHGWKADISRLKGTYGNVRQSLIANGINCLSLCLRGHEDATGDINKVTRQDHQDDLMAAVAWAKENAGAGPLCGFGTSYGGYILSTRATTASFAKIILRASALYQDNAWNEPTAAILAADRNRLLDWRSKIHGPSESVALAEIAKFRGDLLVVSSEKDEDMPPQVAQSYVKTATKAKTLTLHEIKNARHSLNMEQNAEFTDIVTNWLTRNPRP